MSGYQVGFTKPYRSALAQLTPTAQADVRAAVDKVMAGNPSVHVHALKASDFVSFAVNRNALRVLALREAGTLVLVHVDEHDAAYRWAEQHRSVRVGEVMRILRTEVTAEQAGADSGGDALPPGPLAEIRDRTWRYFDVTPPLTEVLRAVPDEDAVMALAEKMQPPLGMALLNLAVDPDGLTEHVRIFQEAQAAPAPTASLAEAAASDANAGWVFAPTADQQLLMDAMSGDAEAWRLFLHPSQQRLVRWRTKGAVKVTGGPGTGKTVVALHRARWLATERLADDARPVLLTTFGRTLANDLQVLWGQLAPELPDAVQVRTLAQVARQLLLEAGQPADLLDGAEQRAAWQQVAHLDAEGRGHGWVRAERRWVCAAEQAWTEQAYLDARRKGRGDRLGRRQRRAVWALISAYDEALRQAGGGDDVALYRDATALAVTHQPWSAVVCDEAQDAGPGALRLMAALAGDGRGSIRPDALTLCGDGFQRLYAASVALSRCGIEVRGRSRRLRLNYRTTEAIRRAAVDVIAGVEVDALDADEASPPLRGYRSLRGGVAPEVRSFADAEAEADWIASIAGATTVPGGEGLLVLARTTAYRDALAERLRSRGVEAQVLTGEGRLAPVTVCTLHRSKGLEAPRVVVAGRHLLPGRWPGEHECPRPAWDRRERCLLYVGMTRARDWCAVVGVDSGG